MTYNKIIQDALSNRTSPQWDKHYEIAARVKRAKEQEANFNKVKDISNKFEFPIKQVGKAADKYMYL